MTEFEYSQATCRNDDCMTPLGWVLREDGFHHVPAYLVWITVNGRSTPAIVCRPCADTAPAHIP